MAVAESYEKIKKSVNDGESNPQTMSTARCLNLEVDVVHYPSPVRIRPLPSYCEKTILLFASTCPPWEVKCINSKFISCIVVFILFFMMT